MELLHLAFVALFIGAIVCGALYTLSNFNGTR